LGRAGGERWGENSLPKKKKALRRAMHPTCKKEKMFLNTFCNF